MAKAERRGKESAERKERRKMKREEKGEFKRKGRIIWERTSLICYEAPRFATWSVHGSRGHYFIHILTNPTNRLWEIRRIAKIATWSARAPAGYYLKDILSEEAPMGFYWGDRVHPTKFPIGVETFRRFTSVPGSPPTTDGKLRHVVREVEGFSYLRRVFFAGGL